MSKKLSDLHRASLHDDDLVSRSAQFTARPVHRFGHEDETEGADTRGLPLETREAHEAGLDYREPQAHFGGAADYVSFGVPPEQQELYEAASAFQKELRTSGLADVDGFHVVGFQDTTITQDGRGEFVTERIVEPMRPEPIVGEPAVEDPTVETAVLAEDEDEPTVETSVVQDRGEEPIVETTLPDEEQTLPTEEESPSPEATTEPSFLQPDVEDTYVALTRPPVTQPSLVEKTQVFSSFMMAEVHGFGASTPFEEQPYTPPAISVHESSQIREAITRTSTDYWSSHRGEEDALRTQVTHVMPYLEETIRVEEPTVAGVFDAFRDSIRPEDVEAIRAFEELTESENGIAALIVRFMQADNETLQATGKELLTRLFEQYLAEARMTIMPQIRTADPETQRAYLYDLALSEGPKFLDVDQETKEAILEVLVELAGKEVELMYKAFNYRSLSSKERKVFWGKLTVVSIASLIGLIFMIQADILGGRTASTAKPLDNGVKKAKHDPRPRKKPVTRLAPLALSQDVVQPLRTVLENGLSIDIRTIQVRAALKAKVLAVLHAITNDSIRTRLEKRLLPLLEASDDSFSVYIKDCNPGFPQTHLTSDEPIVLFAKDIPVHPLIAELQRVVALAK